MKNYKIYVHINNLNGKVYIGQTCMQQLNLRFGKNGGQYKKCIAFWNAIQKYGWNNFKHLLLIDNLTHEQADLIETELIKKYKATNRMFGYNIDKGGRTGAGEKLKKLVYQYNLHGKLIHKWESVSDIEDNTGILVSNISACCLGITKTCANYVWSYEPLELDYFTEINKPNCKRIVLYSSDGSYIDTYNSVVEASIDTGINYRTIIFNANKNGSYITHDKYRWAYEGETLNIQPQGRTCKKAINQYDLDGNFIKIWISAMDIEKNMGFNHSHIAACCNGRYKTSCGYIWEYA